MIDGASSTEGDKMTEQTLVTKSNFDQIFAATKSGDATMYVLGAYGSVVINAKTIAKFENAGHEVIKKAADGDGFYLQQGRSSNYVLPGYLIAV